MEWIEGRKPEFNRLEALTSALSIARVNLERELVLLKPRLRALKPKDVMGYIEYLIGAGCGVYILSKYLN